MGDVRLNLPPVNMRTIEEDGVTKVYDPIRKKFVTLTPEENVRQHFVNWLITQLHYPPALIANEIGIDLNGTRKRCDTVVFGRNGNPLVIVEYKAPEVNVTQDVFDQIVRYNMELRAEYLVVSNGINHYCCKVDYRNNTYHFIHHLPDYRELVAPVNWN